jgi:hypothetical protein
MIFCFNSLLFFTEAFIFRHLVYKLSYFYDSTIVLIWVQKQIHNIISYTNNITLNLLQNVKIICIVKKITKNESSTEIRIKMLHFPGIHFW